MNDVLSGLSAIALVLMVLINVFKGNTFSLWTIMFGHVVGFKLNYSVFQKLSLKATRFTYAISCVEPGPQ
jgi:xanthine/uracil permease